MRSVLYLLTTLAVMALAFWAYRENYRTQAALSEMTAVQRQIANLREDLGVLRAEWAFLNRPERLRELVNLNFDKLRLVPGHCDPTCNVHDWYVGVRNGKVETLWPVSARGKAY